jgi:hypothetical protein
LTQLTTEGTVIGMNKVKKSQLPLEQSKVLKKLIKQLLTELR